MKVLCKGALVATEKVLEPLYQILGKGGVMDGCLQFYTLFNGTNVLVWSPL